MNLDCYKTAEDLLKSVAPQLSDYDYNIILQELKIYEIDKYGLAEELNERYGVDVE